MPYDDLRQFIKACEANNELAVVRDEVDWNLEIGAVTRRTFDLQGPALLFDKIRGYPSNYKFFSGMVSTYRRYALALDLPVDTPTKQIIRTYYERIKKPIPPTVVSTGACKQNKMVGDEVDILKFPTPKYNLRDGGQFIGTFGCVITKDLDDRWVNMGVYRMMIHDSKTTGMFIVPAQHIGYHFAKYRAANKPMPVAVAIGVDPVVVLASCGRYPYNVNELDMAGALRQAPVKLVKCETVDLEVPADAEIVLEGYVDPSKLKREGPFGEYIGYNAGGIQERPVFDIQCVTYRNDPINTGTLEGKPLVEDHIIMSVGNSALSRKALIDDLGIPAVEDIAYHPWSPSNHLVVIATNGNPYPGHDKHVASALWGTKVGAGADWVVIVNKDIDITNLNEIVWAICTRCSPERDITIIPNFYDFAGLVPQGRSPDMIKQRRGLCKVIIDCRFPAWFKKEEIPPVSDFEEFPEEIRNKVIEKFDPIIKKLAGDKISRTE
ncbi:MAG: UbiD family decarboxylase [Nitrososphaerota archaeon]|nr:UbiD family decarboxylase [Nitrososphaerota archaeon]